MIRVMVVDDDPLVAGLHARYVETVEGFLVVEEAHTAAQARLGMIQADPHLVLLDLRLPDGHGLDLCAGLNADVMVISGTSDAGMVRAALARGAVDYLVKPFPGWQLAQRLREYARYRSLGDERRRLTQEEIDLTARRLHAPPEIRGRRGDEGNLTTAMVSDLLRRKGEAISAHDVAGALGISRATAQRHLGRLADQALVTVSLRYGRTGRPQHRYQWIDVA